MGEKLALDRVQVCELRANFLTVGPSSILTPDSSSPWSKALNWYAARLSGPCGSKVSGGSKFSKLVKKVESLGFRR